MESNGEEKLSWTDYTDDLSILAVSVSKMREHLEVLRLKGARIGLKIRRLSR